MTKETASFHELWICDSLYKVFRIIRKICKTERNETVEIEWNGERTADEKWLERGKQGITCKSEKRTYIDVEKV